MGAQPGKARYPKMVILLVQEILYRNQRVGGGDVSNSVFVLAIGRSTRRCLHDNVLNLLTGVLCRRAIVFVANAWMQHAQWSPASAEDHCSHIHKQSVSPGGRLRLQKK